MAPRPEQVVDRQIEAFNRGDADAFAQAYAADAIVVTATSDASPLQGRDAIRDHYAEMFKALPDLRATVAGRLIVGNFVTDHEVLASLNASAIATYEVDGDVIGRAWLFGPMPS